MADSFRLKISLENEKGIQKSTVRYQPVLQMRMTHRKESVPALRPSSLLHRLLFHPYTGEHRKPTASHESFDK